LARTHARYRMGGVVVFAGALAGLIIALFNYFTPLTGVTGTAGAALVIIACAIIGLAAVILPLISGRTGRNVLRLLLLLGALLTGVAGWFLHEWPLIAAMIVALIGVFVDMARPARRAAATEGGL